MTDFGDTAYLIQKYQAKLGLEDWDIRLDAETDIKDDGGKVSHNDAGRVATITLSKGMSESQVEYLIVHELMHLAMSDYSSLVNTAIGKLGGKAATAIMDLAFDQEQRICERVAQALTGLSWEPWSKNQVKNMKPFARAA